MTVIDEQNKFATLDALRGISAIAIAIRHTPHFFPKWIIEGSFLSIDLFFIMSGFVIFLAYEDRLGTGMSALQFLRIRLIRLYPLYFLGSALGILVAVAALHTNGLSIDWPPQLLVTTIPYSMVLLLTPLPGGANVLFPLNPVLWSIFYELETRKNRLISGNVGDIEAAGRTKGIVRADFHDARRSFRRFPWFAGGISPRTPGVRGRSTC